MLSCAILLESKSAHSYQLAHAAQCGSGNLATALLLCASVATALVCGVPLALLLAPTVGLQDVQAVVPSLLHQQLVQRWIAGGWPCGGVATLSIFAVTALPTHPAPAPEATASTDSKTCSTDGGGPLSSKQQPGASGIGDASSNTQDSVMLPPPQQEPKQPQQQQQQNELHARGAVWAELHASGLNKQQLKAAANIAAAGQSASLAGPMGSTITSSSAATAAAGAAGSKAGSTHMGAGASVQATPLQPQQEQQQQQPVCRSFVRRDVAERLLRHGLARLTDAEDVEWLGLRHSRARTYAR